ncbi:MAG: hypothetical protein K9G76_04775 [Bacteroidales bacterium]|nr:hypothetical protein [Bacteroidales bacterium]MCF8402992.1 hypothetical protein [Bacteroidales bacterium]
MAYYSGYLYFASLQNYDIISNYHRSIYSSEHYRIESKIGIGLRQVFSNTAMTPIQLNLLNYFGKRNHKPVAGIGIFTGSEIGFHIPIILGYEYSFCEWFGIQACIEPVVWYGYYSFNGFNNDDWIEKWIWEKNSDNSVLFTLGIMTKF